MIKDRQKMNERYSLPAGVKGFGCYVITDGKYLKIGMSSAAENRRLDYVKHAPNSHYHFFVQCFDKIEALYLESFLQDYILSELDLYSLYGTEWIELNSQEEKTTALQLLAVKARMLGHTVIHVNRRNIDLI